MKTIRKGDRGNEVSQLQQALHLATDGIFGSVTEEAVKEYQRKVGLTADGIVGAKTWAALGIGVTAPEKKRYINTIILHCSATPEGKDYTVADIDRWHRANGWAGIGYHYVIYRDGTIHTGRDINKVGTHCAGHNTGSIGIVYIGGVASDGKTPKDTRTTAQKTAMRTLVRELCDKYGITKDHIFGHNDFTKLKACPSFNVKNEYR